VRVFLAHSIAHSDAEIAQFKADIRKIFVAAGIEESAIVEGREDFKENFATAGGWRGWPHDVVTRRDYLTGENVYDGFILPGYTMGKATGQMLEYAKDRGRDVFALTESGLFDVTAIICEDSSNAKTGWHAQLGEKLT